MSRNWVKDIAEMHQKFKFHDNLEFTGDFLKFRQSFLEEEMTELDDAIRENDPEKVVDALIDLCVVAIGTLDLGDVNSFKAWQVVHNANMSKERADNPTRNGSGGVDLIKPEGWVSPTHKKNLGKFVQAVEELSKKQHSIPSHVKTLDSWREFAISKDNGYNDSDPEFTHASYYPDGIENIAYEMFKKIKRFRSALRKLKNGITQSMVHESIKDSPRDIGIYSAIADTYVKGNLEGQLPNRDMFNREIE